MREMTIGRLFVAVLVSCLGGLLSTPSTFGDVRYVRLDNDRQSPLQPCGVTADSPCGSISQALQRAAAPRTIFLLHSSALVAINETDDLTGARDVSISPVDGEPLKVSLVLSDSNQSWLLLQNASNISISGLAVNMAGSEGHAVHIERAQDVWVLNSTFSEVGKNSHAVFVRDALCVMLSDDDFKGRTSPEAPPDLDETYISSALRVMYGLRSDGLTNACSAARHSRSEASYALWVQRSRFAGLGFADKDGIYRRQMPKGQSTGEATAIHIHFWPTAVGGVIVFDEVVLANNSSPYDPSMTVDFRNGSVENTVSFVNSRAEGTQGYIAGVMYVRFGGAGNNTVSLGNSRFLDNTAKLEASVARVVFEGRAADRLLKMQDHFLAANCDFTQNKAGFSAARMPGTFVLTTMHTEVTRRSESFSAVFRNCVFDSNVASQGSAIYMVESAVQVVDW